MTSVYGLATPGDGIGRLLDGLGPVPAHRAVANVCYAAVAVAVVAEVGARWWRDRRPEPLRHAAAAAAMAAGALAVGAAYTLVFHRLWTTVGSGAPEVLVDLWRDRPAIALGAAFVAWDASGFVYHVIGHRTRLGWAAHRPHHTGAEYDLSLALRLSWFPWHGLLHHPLLALAGWDFRTIVLCVAVSNVVQALQHTSRPVRVPGWVAAVFMTPEHHRHHHVAGAEAVNLGPVLTCWDRLAGTYRTGPVADGTRYGLGRPASTNPLRAELDGWRQLVGRPRPGVGPADVRQ